MRRVSSDLQIGVARDPAEVPGGSHARQQLINTPSAYFTRVPINEVLPAFWLAAGAEDKRKYQRRGVQARLRSRLPPTC